MTRYQVDLPIIKKTVVFTSPRAVILLNSTAPLVISLLVISIIFTIWPEALDHTPISFERRGIVHHFWHYSLLTGAIVALVGQFGQFRGHLRCELIGLIMLIGALGVNLVALIGNILDPDPTFYPSSGVALALRVGVMVLMAIRCYILVFRPTVTTRIEVPG